MSSVCSLPRSFHCEVIAADLDPTPTPRRNYCGPYKEFMLPNDRGALLGPGTTRLPLDRHKCAQVLWRFFGDMGDMDANGEAMETLSRIQVHHLMQFKSRAFDVLSEAVNNAFNSPSYALCDVASDTYCRFIYLQSKYHGVRFVNLLWETFHVLKCFPSETASRFDHAQWLQELRKKKASNWIERMDRQFAKAQATREVGDEYFEENDICMATWFYLRALFDICPWLPSAWYLSDEEGQQLARNDLVGHCCNRIAYFAWKSNRDDLAIMAAAFTADQPFNSHRSAVVAHELSKISRSYKESKCYTRTAGWYQMLGLETMSDKFWSKGLFLGVTFSLSDVVHWAAAHHQGGKKSKVWDFDRRDFAKIVMDANNAWRKTYGYARKPFHWDGTEDEALGLELGKDPEEDIKEYINTPIRTPHLAAART